jgi:hypothetical protein
MTENLSGPAAAFTAGTSSALNHDAWGSDGPLGLPNTMMAARGSGRAMLECDIRANWRSLRKKQITDHGLLQWRP